MNPTQQPLNKVITADEEVARGLREGRVGRSRSARSTCCLLCWVCWFSPVPTGSTFCPRPLPCWFSQSFSARWPSRVVHARRGELEYGLLRHPLRRDLRPCVLAVPQPLVVLGSVRCHHPGRRVRARTGPDRAALFSLPSPNRIPYQPLLIALGVGAVMMAALAMVPRRRVQVATNALVAIGTVFLAVQLIRISVPID